MAIDWNSIVEGVTAGVVASVLLGIFALSRDSFRNAALRLRLIRTFRRMSCGTYLDGITVGIDNHTGRAFTVREVIMVTDKGNYRFNPTGDVSSSFKNQDPKPTRKQIRMLKRGAAISGFRIVVEYEGWTHRIKIIQVRESRSRDQVQKTVEQFRKQIQDGSLNAARVKFRQPPIILRAANHPSQSIAEPAKGGPDPQAT
jgi:hypothetical protein